MCGERQHSLLLPGAPSRDGKLRPSPDSPPLVHKSQEIFQFKNLKLLNFKNPHNLLRRPGGHANQSCPLKPADPKFRRPFLPSESVPLAGILSEWLQSVEHGGGIRTHRVQNLEQIDQ